LARPRYVLIAIGRWRRRR